MTSGRRKEPPISTNWPRETITSLPAATELSTMAVAAALLLTTVAASAPVNCCKSSSIRSSRRDRAPLDRSICKSE